MGSISRYLRQNVLGLVAIFLALNAGAYAITTNSDLATGSVNSRALATGAVRAPDIRNAAVGPKKIKLEKLLAYLRTQVNGRCPEGETVQGILADGSVLCAPDDTGAETITAITTSGGLTGGGSSGEVALGIDPTAVQARVSGSCSGTQWLQAINQNGTVGCQAIPADTAAGTPALRSLGTGAAQAAAGDDPRLSDARTPTGPAGGELSGNYPNPTLANDSVDAATFAALPHAKVRQTGTCQTIASDFAFQQVQFNDLQFASGVTFDNADDSVTVSRAGTYLVSGYVSWPQNGAGSRGLMLVAGGALLAYDGRQGTTGFTTGQTASGLVRLAAGQTLASFATHNSGSGLQLIDPFVSLGCANLSVQWIGP